MTESLNVEDFAQLLGTDADDFDGECRKFIAKTDFSYSKLSQEKRDKTILEVAKKVNSGLLTCAGKEGKDRWEKGWSENLENFISNGYDLSELVPKYVRPNQVVRLYREYVMPSNANYELNFFTILRLWLFKKYFKDIDVLYEFACGPGYNLPLLARLFPEKELHGLDWSDASVKIANLIGEKHEMNVTGHLFDMFSPDYGLNINTNSAVMTIGGLEQLGDNHQPFVNFLLEKSPMLCVHVEPIYELYDENNLVDYLAMMFHRKRNYLMNFLPSLKKLELEGKIQFIKIHRLHFGSLFHDGWSLVIWKPRIAESL